ncbi:uncharacterized protein LOC144559252 [Carex rostrata]
MAEQLVLPSPPKNGALTLHLPVILSEGRGRVHFGNLSVHPSIGFKKLQLDLSKMIGVPPYQMTSFLERSTSHRLPIDEKMDLSVLSREEGDWKILAIVRRPGNGRSRRGRRTKGGSRAFTEDRKPQPEKIILRRNDSSNTPVVYDLMYGPVSMMPMWGNFYQPQISDVQTETQRLWRGTWHAREPAPAVCAICEDAAYLGVDAAFHCCCRDEIVEVGSFVRSPVGPIERPSVKRVESFA